MYAILNNKKQDKQKVISKLYHVFIDCSVVNTDNVRQKWEQDLHMEIQKRIGLTFVGKLLLQFKA